MPKKNNVEKDLVSAAAASTPARRRLFANRNKHAAVEQTSTPARTTESTRIAIEPSREEIAKLAFLYWEARGCQGGSEEADWLRAELELRSR
ncbi:MAG: DUF2934 domain-containing protein [Bryobacteraceae bacterium]|jgi:ABC-type uncharacterized transport system auxiliary subunit